MRLNNAIFELYRKAASEVPEEIMVALKKAENYENQVAKEILMQMRESLIIGKKDKKPICQDTGNIIFFVDYPHKYSQIQIIKEIEKATSKATKEIPLRINSIDIITNKPLNKNFPIIYFNGWPKNFIKIELLLKGGGSENISGCYKLPNKKLNAERNLEGIKKCVIDAVFKAQGLGCPPYIIGIGISGFKLKSYEIALKQLLRKLNDKNKDKTLEKLENGLLKDINKLGIGPAGLGGKTTALAVKIGAFPRHPASYFVAVNFMCWSFRRHSMKFLNGDASYD